MVVFQLPRALLKAQALRSMSSSSPSMAKEAEKFVSFERHGNKGIIILDRPKALNALNYEMVKRLYTQLKTWNTDSEIRMVMIKSAHQRAFSAGGDIKYIASSPLEEGKRFFRQEYMLNHLIVSLSVPYVSLIDGIVMGGGCGLSMHGNYRVVTENALFAMPETGIGLFPDVGASHFLQKLPGSLGLYVGLTGERLSGRDLFKAGIGTHFIPSERMGSLEQEIMRLDKPDQLNIDRVLQKHQEQWQDDWRREFPLKSVIGRMNSIFGEAKSVEDIVAGLEREKSKWGLGCVETLRKMSPTSLKVTFEELKRGKTMSLPESLKMEYRIAVRILERGTEFAEGVRAVLVDKDNKPNWNPAELKDVKEADVMAYFEPLPANEELKFD